MPSAIPRNTHFLYPNITPIGFRFRDFIENLNLNAFLSQIFFSIVLNTLIEEY